MSEQQTSAPGAPQARVAQNRSRISIVWIVPIVAAVVGAWVAVARIMSEGPTIKITFASADGLEAGKTKIQYKGVDVGTITHIQLSENHERIEAIAQMAPKTEDFLVGDTNFWVVRPRISGANVTGLGTLISGAYIGMEIGQSRESKREFVALENPPVISGGIPGRYFMLKTSNLGSLDTGTPVFFRRLQVGEVSSYQLDKDGKLFTLRVFVHAPYDQYITENTRFWQASGIDVKLSATGLDVQTQSLLSILIGGIAFETPATGPVLPAADADSSFTLYLSRTEAFEPPAINPQTYQFVFDQSVRGLSPGAPVEFRGIKIGQVVDVRAQVDMKTLRFSAPVVAELEPQRLGVKLIDMGSGETLDSMRRKLIDAMVARGVRAQLQTGNLLTGAAFIELDYVPGAKPAKVDWTQYPVELPTAPGQLVSTEAQLTNIIKKFDALPIDEIGSDLHKSLVSLNETLMSAQGTLTSAQTTINNADGYVEPNSAQAQELANALQEISRAARSVRVLADYLEQHPEALLRGKPGGPK
ncbi:MAG TPA: MlaD family protein [Candidatus Binataceae bacterium]|nr:MlaD family protein [Candidatus Binataceae bacterium]